MPHFTKIFILICVASLLPGLQAKYEYGDPLHVPRICLNETVKHMVIMDFAICQDQETMGKSFNETFAKFCDKHDETVICYRSFFHSTLSCNAGQPGWGNALLNITTDFFNSLCAADRTAPLVDKGIEYLFDKLRQVLSCITLTHSEYSAASMSFGAEYCKLMEQAEICLKGKFKDITDGIVFNSIRGCSNNYLPRFEFKFNESEGAENSNNRRPIHWFIVITLLFVGIIIRFLRWRGRDEVARCCTHII